MTQDEERRLRLRQGCGLVLPGFRTLSPAEEFRRIAAWCEVNSTAHDNYGEGELIAGFERKLAGLVGKPAAAFMPSGVMAQLIALRIWTLRAALPRFGMHPTSHLALNEHQAYQALFQLHGVLVGDRLRPLVADDLEDEHQPLACLLVELPIREAGGQLPEWDELQALKTVAERRHIPLHMDGARLWECGAFYGRSHADIAAGFASVYVSVYKALGGLAGAVLAGDEDFVAEARLWQRRIGGMLVRQSPMIASAAMRLDERLALLGPCYERTLSLAAALGEIPGLRVNPARPQTNMIHLFFDAPAETIMRRRDEIAERDGVWVIGAARASEVPGWCVAELTVGDTLLELENAMVLPRFRSLLDPAPH